MATPPVLRKLNLGCGARALPSWTNLDFVARPGLVTAHDLRTALPFADGCFDAVYHSHVLEHFDRPQGARLLAECFRVLRPGGTLRVVVPDLEGKARLYLEKLAAANHGDEHARAEHEWMVIELVDQMVRTHSGGSMQEFLTSGQAEAFLQERIGDEFVRAHVARKTSASDSTAPRPGAREWIARLWRRLAGLSEEEWQWLRFRRLGEVHLWMYDRVSLANTLVTAGFANCGVCSAFQSRIPGWETDDRWLDVDAGRSRKPDSLYMEASKPAPSP